MATYARSRPDPLDRRLSPRSQTDLKAVVKLDDGDLPCAIRDRSSGGARLVLASDKALPNRFRLVELKSGREHVASLIWTDKRQAGVRLEEGGPGEA